MVTINHKLDPIFRALGDPVRREILAALASGPLGVTRITRRFAISRPAVSRHLRVLREAGLVSHTSSGRTKVYELERHELRAAENAVRALWQGRLRSLKQLAEAD